MSIVGSEVGTPVMGLVDTGCGHIIAAPWVAMTAGVDPRDSSRCIKLGLGGETLEVRFVDMQIRLHAPSSESDDEFVEWEDEVGFVNRWRPTWPILLGQVAFMKRFTVTMSRLAQATAIEDGEEFDRRYPAPLAP